MSETETPRRSLPVATVIIAAVCALLGATAGLAWHAYRSGPDRAATEQIVHDYLMAHPEILPQAMAELERKQNASQLAGVRGQVEATGAGTVLGNPAGKVTLVEFSDYACGYCRQSLADVDALIAANPDLRVVIREMPILSPGSAQAARMAIAAAQQGRYAEFHKAMFETGRPDAASIEAAAKVAGLDIDQARKVAASPATEQELVRNLEMAKQLGFSGTPSWVVGENLFAGAVGKDQLSEALAKVRGG